MTTGNIQHIQRDGVYVAPSTAPYWLVLLACALLAVAGCGHAGVSRAPEVAAPASAPEFKLTLVAVNRLGNKVRVQTGGGDAGVVNRKLDDVEASFTLRNRGPPQRFTLGETWCGIRSMYRIHLIAIDAAGRESELTHERVYTIDCLITINDPDHGERYDDVVLPNGEERSFSFRRGADLAPGNYRFVLRYDSTSPGTLKQQPSTPQWRGTLESNALPVIWPAPDEEPLAPRWPP